MAGTKHTKQRGLASLFNGCRDNRVRDVAVSWGTTCLGGREVKVTFVRLGCIQAKVFSTFPILVLRRFSFCSSLPFNVSRMVLTAPYSLPQVDKEKLIDADKVQLLPSGET